jgi:sulfur carrier protein
MKEFNTMKLTINGNEEIVDKTDITISDLLVIKSVKMPEMVSVEYNGDILDRSQFDQTTLSEGDKVEFIYFMGGGSLLNG